MNKKTYLGDSVYGEWNGFRVTLTTDNGFGPSNTIVMEPEVIEAFILFVEAIEKAIKEGKVTV